MLSNATTVCLGGSPLGLSPHSKNKETYVARDLLSETPSFSENGTVACARAKFCRLYEPPSVSTGLRMVREFTTNKLEACQCESC